ncbi:MAG: glycoside hydrolase family 5 protein [Lachnospiraceae bacterium]|nr:glycoside hydrolase family 5 protein [Lachnospiraceae bacterium]
MTTKTVKIGVIPLIVTLLFSLFSACTPLPTVDEGDTSAQTNDIVAPPPSTNPMAAITAVDLVAQMKIGWNLGNTLDVVDGSRLRASSPSGWETGWGNPVTTPELFATLYDYGFNVFRIPVSWNDHLMINNDYQIVESWMERVKEVVDYAYATGAFVILNTHHESWAQPYYERQDRASYILERVWTQVADVFADYSERLIFEGLNEPRQIGTPNEWNGGNQEGWDVVNLFNEVFIETVRQSGGNNPYRVLMIPSYAANAWEAPKHLWLPPDDDKIIVSIHAYEPYDFALRVGGRGEWNEDRTAIDQIMRQLDELFISRGIPVLLDEFGAMYKPVAGNEEERAAWAAYYVGEAAKVGIPCLWWDNGAFTGSGELFGIINRETYEFVYPLVAEALIKNAR